MQLSSFRFLCDANIHTDVVQFLRDKGSDVATVAELGLSRSPDDIILDTAFQQDRVVVTHDRDFGTLAILAGQPLFGIIYLRPGHIDPMFTIETIQAIETAGFTISPPFSLVGQRRGDRVHMRLRSLAP